ncbi:hypothetical protein ACNJQH_21125, partial [Mycobacterium tuberculosis]
NEITEIRNRDLITSYTALQLIFGDTCNETGRTVSIPGSEGSKIAIVKALNLKTGSVKWQRFVVGESGATCGCSIDMDGPIQYGIEWQMWDLGYSPTDI